MTHGLPYLKEEQKKLKCLGFAIGATYAPKMMDLVTQVQVVHEDHYGVADMSSNGPGSMLLEGIRFRLVIASK